MRRRLNWGSETIVWREGDTWQKRVRLDPRRLHMGRLNQELRGADGATIAAIVAPLLRDCVDAGLYAPGTEIGTEGVYIAFVMPHLRQDEEVPYEERRRLARVADRVLDLGAMHADFRYAENFGHLGSDAYYLDTDLFPRRWGVILLG